MGFRIEVTETAICRKRGDTFPIEITVSDVNTGLPLDITGNTFTLSVSPENAPAVANYTFQSTGSILVAVDGTVSFAISAANADNVGIFYFDVEMVAGTFKTTIMGGTFEFNQDITK